jgi:hypothetical protein
MLQYLIADDQVPLPVGKSGVLYVFSKIHGSIKEIGDGIFYMMAAEVFFGAMFGTENQDAVPGNFGVGLKPYWKNPIVGHGHTVRADGFETVQHFGVVVKEGNSHEADFISHEAAEISSTARATHISLPADILIE